MKANKNETIDDISSALILHERNVAPVLASSSSSKVLEVCGNKSRFYRKIKPQNCFKNEPSQTVNKNSEVICKYCNRKGHFIRQCARWKADGKPPYPVRVGRTVLNKNTKTSINETESKLALTTVISEIFLVFLLMKNGGLIMVL